MVNKVLQASPRVQVVDILVYELPVFILGESPSALLCVFTAKIDKRRLEKAIESIKGVR